MPAKVATDHFVKTVAANSPFSVPRGEVRRVYEELATSLGVNMTSVRRRLQSLLADYKTGKSHGDEVDGYLKQLADEVEASGGADRRRKPARERSPSENLPTGGDPEEEEARGHEVPPVRQRSAAIAAALTPGATCAVALVMPSTASVSAARSSKFKGDFFIVSRTYFPMLDMVEVGGVKLGRCKRPFRALRAFYLSTFTCERIDQTIWSCPLQLLSLLRPSSSASRPCVFG